jgi:hypothetical protein
MLRNVRILYIARFLENDHHATSTIETDGMIIAHRCNKEEHPGGGMALKNPAMCIR